MKTFAVSRFVAERRENRYKAAVAFVHGEATSPKAGSVYSTGDALLSYGKHFPMALRGANGGVWVNTGKASVTTSRHQSALCHVLADAGYEAGVEERQGWELGLTDHPLSFFCFRLWR